MERYIKNDIKKIAPYSIPSPIYFFLFAKYTKKYSNCQPIYTLPQQLPTPMITIRVP